jgi:AraC-like DNA-binding protein/Tfp pilus assembly protein PilF
MPPSDIPSPSAARSQKTLQRGNAMVLPKGVLRATAFIREHSDRPMTLEQIAAAASLSKRRLQKQFRRFVGVSPMGLLRQVRLERAHDDFLCSTQVTRVTTVATNRGFNHLGRFSVAYRSLYQERPSETSRAGPVGRQLIDRLQPVLATMLDPERWRAELGRASTCRPDHPDALALALEALPLASIAEPGSATRALDLLGQASDRDPGYALPRALAAWCHAQRVVYTWTGCPASEREAVLRLAADAARLDHGNATVQTVLCAAHSAIGDLPSAERCIELALQADPSSHWAWQRSAWLQLYRGDAASARTQFRHALRLDPAAPQVFNTYIGLGLAGFDLGEYRDAAGWIRLGLRSSPIAAWSHRVLAAAEARLGRKDEARLSATRLRRAQPDISIGQIVATLPVNADFLARLAEGLETAGIRT